MFRVFGLLILVCQFVFASVDASMEIVKNVGYKPSVAVVSSQSETLPSKHLDDIHKLLEKDLEVSGHFNVKRVNTNQRFESNINFYEYKKLDIDLVINITTEQSIFEGFLLKLKLYDTNLNKLVLEKSINSPKDDRYPFIAHKVAIDINNYIKAPSIGWMERFVIFSRYTAPKESQIVVADYTLTYQKVIVQKGLNIFPKWADEEQENFYYTTYNFGKPTLMKVNIFNAQAQKITQSDGMLVCSDVSKDGKKILLTMAPNSQPDIYEYNTISKQATRITDFSGIDVNGHYLEGEKSIVFVSDRQGNPNIFKQEIGQRIASKLVYHGKNNNSANAFGNLVVYTSREGENVFGYNNFNIYLISTESSFIKKLTTSGMNQFPKFSRDGESIIFIKTENNKSSLGIIRLNHDKSFLFPLANGSIQSIDW